MRVTYSVVESTQQEWRCTWSVWSLLIGKEPDITLPSSNTKCGGSASSVVTFQHKPLEVTISARLILYSRDSFNN